MLRENWNKKLDYSGSYFPFLKYSGIIFGGGKNGEIVTSNDGWNSIATLKNIGASEEITCMNIFKDGVLIIGTYSGNVYRSVSPYTTFTKVLHMVGTNVWPLTWSLTGNANIIFIGEYGAKGSDPNANGRRIYKSTDNGLTWTLCWTTPFTTGSHIHKVILDQYTNNLYVCTGDGTTYARVFQLSPPNYDTGVVLVSGIQPTGGIVFPSYNLWVQDIQPHGIYKHDKTTNAINLVLDLNNFPGYSDTGFDGLILAPNNTTVYYATFPTESPATQMVGVFKSEPPYTNWELIASIDEFVNSGTVSDGVRCFYDVSSDTELYGQFAFMPNPYGVRRTRAIKFTHFSQDLRP